MADELIREFEIAAAYDKRVESGGRYGQHCVDFRFYLKGPKGVVQFILCTGWSKAIIATPEKPWQELGVVRTRNNPDVLWDPMPADLGYHSPVPRYEDQTAMDCHILPEGKCYYDGSGLNANRIFSLMVHEGGEAMWKALERYYRELFEERTVANV
jgi:hypothetical protein